MEAFLRFAKRTSSETGPHDDATGLQSSNQVDTATSKNPVNGSANPAKSPSSFEQRLAASSNKGASNALAAAGKGTLPGKTVEGLGSPLEGNTSRVTIQLEQQHRSGKDPQLEGTTITKVATAPSSELRKLIAVNKDYITYALPKGQIRALFKHSSARALLKHHSAMLVELRFLGTATSTLASIDSEGRVVITSLQSAAADDQIKVDQLLNLSIDGMSFIRSGQAAWPPQSTDVLALAVENRVLICSIPYLVEQHGPEIACTSEAPGITVSSLDHDVTALSFSEGDSRLAVGSSAGRITIMSWQGEIGVKIAEGNVSGNVSSLTWLSSERLLIGIANNRELQMWQSMSDGGFWPLQTVVFEGQSLQMNNLAFDSSSRLILLTNAQSSTLTVLHVSEGLGRFDSVACFELNVPTISMEILSLQSSGVEADALQVYAVQTNGIKQFVLHPASCLTPRLSGEEPQGNAPGAPPSSRGPTADALMQTGPQTVPSVSATSDSTGVQKDGIQIPPNSEHHTQIQSPPAGPTPTAMAPPEPSTLQINHLLTPSQLMLASKAALPRSASQASSVLESDRLSRPPSHNPYPAMHPITSLKSRSSSTQPPLDRDPASVSVRSAAAGQIPERLEHDADGTAPAANNTNAEEAGQSSGAGNLNSKAVRRDDVDAQQRTVEPEWPGPPSASLMDTGFAPNQATEGSRENGPASGSAQVASSGSHDSSSQLQLMEQLLRAQFRHLEEMQQQQQQAFKEMREEHRNELKRLEERLEAQTSQLMHAQLRIVAEERNAITKEERQNMERLLITISGSIHKDLPQLFEETLHQEMAGATASLAGAVKASITEVMPKDLLGSGFQVLLEKSLASQLKSALAKPIQDNFRSSFQHQLLPAFEGACQSMFAQVQATFAGGLAEHLQAAGGVNAAIASSLKESISQADTLAGQLSQDLRRDVEQLRELVGAQIKGRQGHDSLLQAPRDHKADALKLLEEKKYTEAFTMVLELGDDKLVAWLCSNLDPHTVLGSQPALLSQHILLALLQQLGHNLTEDTGVKLAWIKEIASELDPEDATLQSHLSSIALTVLKNLRQSPFQGKDARTARLASAVLESTAMSCGAQL